MHHFFPAYFCWIENQSELSITYSPSYKLTINDSYTLEMFFDNLVFSSDVFL